MESVYDYKEYAILYVDDEAKMLKYFDLGLSKDFRILTASSAAKAWQIAEEHGDQIAVVISDQKMPEESGVDLLGRFRNEYPDVVRILTTAHSDTKAAEESVNIGGAFRYINKPWDFGELRGALLRAMEFFLLRKDRERLLKEKLSVVQRMIILDRVRSLAVLAASLGGRLENAASAFISYVEQSPLEERIALELPNAEELDIMSIFRTESACMIESTRRAIDSTSDAQSEAVEEINVPDALRAFIENSQVKSDEEGLTLAIDPIEGEPKISCGKRSLHLLLEILANRIGDMDGDDRTIRFGVSDNSDGSVSISVRADGPAWRNGQIASLFSAIMPLQRYPLGIDMDILNAFFLAGQCNAEIKVNYSAPLGPGFEIRFGGTPRNAEMNDAWFDGVFAAIEKWREPAM